MKSNWMKLLILVVVAAMSLSLFACGDNADETDTNAPDVTTETKSDETTDKKADQTTEKRDETTAAEGDSTTDAGDESTSTTDDETGDTETTTGGDTETTEPDGTGSNTESDTEPVVDSSSETEEEPTETTTETDSETETAEPTETTTEMDTSPIEEIVAGSEVKADASYYFKLVIEKNGKELYLKGGMSTVSGRSFALGVTEDRAEAVQVRLETAEGGFYMYYIENAVKVYINVVKSGNYTNSVLQSTPSSVWTFDTELGTLVTSVGDKSYFLGTRNDKDYNDFTPCETQYTSNYKGQLTVVKTWDDSDYVIDCDHPYLATAEGHLKVACAHCGKNAGSPKDHSMKSQTVEGDETIQISSVCSTCGYTVVIDEYNKNINKYITPDEIAAIGHFQANASMVTDDGERYVHLVMTGASNGASHINLWSASGGGGSVKAFDANTGNFIVVKYRTSTLGSIKFEASTGGNSLSGITNASPNTLNSDNACIWRIAVVDVSKFANYQTNTEKEDMTLQLRWTVNYTGANVGSATNAPALDIAYVAIVDSFAEAATLLDDGETISMYSNWSEGFAEVNADNTCKIHHMKSINTETEIRYFCDYCDRTIYQKNLPANVSRYFAPGDIATTKNHNYNTGFSLLFDDVNSLLFARITGGGGTGQTIISRFGGDGGVDGATKLWSDKGALKPIYNLGTNVNYLVFKIRKSDDVSSVDFALGTVRGEKTLENYKAGNSSSKSIKLPLSDMTANEWVTFVIDLKAVFGDAWKADGDVYKMTTLMLTYNSGSGDKAFTSDKHFDFAYFSFEEDIAGVKANLTEGEALRAITGTNASVGVTITDENKLACAGAHQYVGTTTTADGKKIAVQACTVCGTKATEDKTFPESVAVYFSACDINGKATGSTQVERSEFKIDDGQVYTRIYGDKNSNITQYREYSIRFLVSNDNNTNKTMETGQFVVFKYRASKGTSIKFYTGNINTNSGAVANDPTGEDQGVTINMGDTDEWHTVIIDLEAYMNNTKDSGKAGLVKNDDGKYYINFLQFRFFTSCFDEATAEDYFDLEYFAICKSIDDAVSLIDEENYTHYTTADGVDKVTETKLCVNHEYKYDKDSNNHKITGCENCSYTPENAVDTPHNYGDNDGDTCTDCGYSKPAPTPGITPNPGLESQT